MDKTVFITGATGFIGSHVVEELLYSGYRVVASKRSTSDTWRLNDHLDRIEWVCLDSKNWQEKILNLAPQIFIHAAWQGVNANQRSDWKSQVSNLNLQLELLQLANSVGAQKFIGLGSQAEYGYFDGIIDETYPANPTNSYGLVKLMAMQLTKCFCEQNNIQWHWLRLFPFYGEKESVDWFIPMLVKNILDYKEMKMTKGEQKYAYLYVKDFAEWMKKIMEGNIVSGVYNISSKMSYSLVDVVEKVIKKMNTPVNNVQIGALPYRPNQSMLLSGDIQKIEAELGPLNESVFEDKLASTIDYIIQNQEHYQL